MTRGMGFLLGILFLALPLGGHSPLWLEFPDLEQTPRATLYPVGWSQDGKFAYWKLKPPASPPPQLSLRINDLVTDTDVSVLNLALSPYPAHYGQLVRGPWRSRQEEIERLLNSYRIVPQAMISLYRFPFFERGAWISGVLKQGLEKWSLFLTKDKPPQTKSVAQGTQAVRLEGFVESPLENRLAILLSFNSSEGYLDYEWHGSHLGVGWQAQKEP